MFGPGRMFSLGGDRMAAARTSSFQYLKIINPVSNLTSARTSSSKYEYHVPKDPVHKKGEKTRTNRSRFMQPTLSKMARTRANVTNYLQSSFTDFQSYMTKKENQVEEKVLTPLNQLRRNTLHNFHYRTYSMTSAHNSFLASQIEITRVPVKQRPPRSLKNVPFGSVFTDHMLTIEWSKHNGWAAPKIQPLVNLQLHPASTVFHYGVEMFEGMKAYHTAGGISMFRPWLNMERLQQGAVRGSLPTFDKQELLDCIARLVAIDSEWVPKGQGTSLYIRPTFVGTQASIGLQKPKNALLFCLMSPVGPYFKGGMTPISLLADPQYVRSTIGGVGQYKFGSNYGPTLWVMEQAQEQGLDSNLWLYGEDRWITEAGAFNIFIYWKNEVGENEILTLGLEHGLILPGITRLSVIEILREWNVPVKFWPLGMEEFRRAIKANRVFEMFGTGTAACIVPITKIQYNNEMLMLPNTRFPVAQSLHKELTRIQYGASPHPWTYYVTRR